MSTAGAPQALPDPASPTALFQTVEINPVQLGSHWNTGCYSSSTFSCLPEQLGSLFQIYGSGRFLPWRQPQCLCKPNTVLHAHLQCRITNGLLCRKKRFVRSLRRSTSPPPGVLAKQESLGAAGLQGRFCFSAVHAPLRILRSRLKVMQNLRVFLFLVYSQWVRFCPEIWNKAFPTGNFILTSHSAEFNPFHKDTCWWATFAQEYFRSPSF